MLGWSSCALPHLSGLGNLRGRNWRDVGWQHKNLERYGHSLEVWSTDGSPSMLPAVCPRFSSLRTGAHGVQKATGPVAACGNGVTGVHGGASRGVHDVATGSPQPTGSPEPLDQGCGATGTQRVPEAMLLPEPIAPSGIQLVATTIAPDTHGAMGSPCVVGEPEHQGPRGRRPEHTRSPKPTVSTGALRGLLHSQGHMPVPGCSSASLH